MNCSALATRRGDALDEVALTEREQDEHGQRHHERRHHDELVVAVTAGGSAVGARMTGGGFGGSAIVLLPEEQLEPAAASVEQAFAEAGYAAPAFLTARPSGPGRLVAS